MLMKKYLSISLWVVALVSSLAIAAVPPSKTVPLITGRDANPSSWHRIEIDSRDQVLEVWDKYNFTTEAIKDGERTIPRIYLSTIPARWGQTVAPGLTVHDKKITFLFALAPMVLAVDEELVRERNRLKLLIAQHKAGKPWDQSGKIWFHELATRYGIKDNEITSTTLDELATRVDTIPASLVLAQAADESGWGTSRFAAQGNALFGQWTYEGNGINPREQRTASKGDYEVRAFANPMDSIRAYFLNLNTHRTYEALRQKRRTLREEGKPVTGIELSSGLLKYSERGQVYVDELRELIHRNHLDLADNMSLRDMTPILLIPVGEGVD
jgi:uncharacterized FlgJ-related protein